MAYLLKKIPLNTVKIMFPKQEQVFTFVNRSKTLLLRMFKLWFRNCRKKIKEKNMNYFEHFLVKTQIKKYH